MKTEFHISSVKIIAATSNNITYLLLKHYLHHFIITALLVSVTTPHTAQSKTTRTFILSTAIELFNTLHGRCCLLHPYATTSCLAVHHVFITKLVYTTMEEVPCATKVITGSNRCLSWRLRNERLCRRISTLSTTTIFFSNYTF